MNPSTLKRYLPDWFLLGMGIAVLLAWLVPAPGAKGGSLHPELITRIGIALIFFLHGLLLSPAALKAGALRWKLHLIIQSATFILFPLLGLAFMAVGKGTVGPELALGFFYLCALPSTVSSSVALTAAARGDVPVAVFNATLSSLLGIVLTPLWVGLVWEQVDGASLDLSEVVIDLVRLLVLPMLAGQLLRPWLGAFAQRHKPVVGKVDRVTILLLVYTSFCDAFAGGIWQQTETQTLFITLGCSVLLLFLVLGIMQGVARALKLTHGEQAAVVFCGSKKSLATGVPMAQVMFAGQPMLGVVLLPIMLYHSVQLVVGAVLAARWAKRSN